MIPPELILFAYYGTLAFWIVFGATIGYLTAKAVWMELDKLETWIKRRFTKHRRNQIRHDIKDVEQPEA